MKKHLALVLCLCPVAAVAQKPVAQLPKTYIDTTFRMPNGVTRHAHTSASFQSALHSASPGDIIVLDAGATYQGNFTLPAKSNPNNKWIFIVGSALSSLRAPGTRVNPATDAVKMPKIVTPNYVDTLELLSGANHYRFVGLEIYSASSVGHTTGGLINSHAALTNLPDSITVDRCYIHGSPTINVQRGVQMIGTNFAVVDSYISEIHFHNVDAQALAMWWGNGPVKIVNNYLSAGGEVVGFGGSGGVSNPTVPSDIEIRNNYFYLPMAWDAPGISLPPNPTLVVKNLFELKSARRVLFDGNVLENIWPAAQMGFAFNIKVATSSSGNIAVTDDITITNNVIKNASSGVDFLPYDPYCAQTQGCTNPGEVKRVVIRNNLFLLGDTTQLNYANGYAMGMLINANDATDLVFQHNTVVPPPNLGYCKFSIYFGAPTPPVYPLTHNVWILDNLLCRQVDGGGSNGYIGQFPNTFSRYMGDPAPPGPRFLGNVFYAPSHDIVYSIPAHNYISTVPFTYVNPSIGDYQLSIPNWTDTSDGKIAGVNNSILP